MALPRDVTEALDALLRGTREVLADNLVGIYLRGSLATGAFLATSDTRAPAIWRPAAGG